MPIKPIARAIREVKSSVQTILLFNSFVDSLLFFLIVVLVLKLVNVKWYYSFVAFVPYFVLHTRNAVKSAKLKLVEQKVPVLEEQLITAADHTRESNQVLEELNDDVLKHMKSVHTSYFFSFGRLMRQVCIMSILAFVIIGLASANVYLVDFKQTMSELKELSTSTKFYEVDEGQLSFEEGQNLSEILGDKNIAELGSEVIDLEINPILSDIDISKIHEPEEHDFRNVVPSNIEAVSDVSFEESIPKNYQRIVKNYFRQISKT